MRAPCFLRKIWYNNRGAGEGLFLRKTLLSDSCHMPKRGFKGPVTKFLCSASVLSTALALVLMAAPLAASAATKDYSAGGAVAVPHDNTAEEPKGYPGLIPGAAEPAFDTTADVGDAGPKSKPKSKDAAESRDFRTKYAPALTSTARDIGSDKFSTGPLPKISYPAGFSPRMRPLTLDDVKILAGLSARGIDFYHLPPEMEKRLHLPPGTSKALNNIGSARIDGMLPAEFSAKQQIDQQMNAIGKLQGEQRRKAAEAAYDQLSYMAGGYRTLHSIPDSIYGRMGVSDTYVKEEREGYGKSLDRFKEALDALDKIKKAQ